MPTRLWYRRRWRRAVPLLMLAVVAAPAGLAAPEPADAHGLRHAMKIAERTWNEPCEGRTRVLWRSKRAIRRAARRADLSGRFLALATFRHDRTNCRIRILRRLRTGWSWRGWERLCHIVVHEYGHLAGRRHSRNPRSVMFSRANRHTFRACRR